jgi:hypothetical protein
MVFNDDYSGDDPERKEVGTDIILEIAGGTETAITNVSFSEEANTSEVQYNTGFHQDIAVTGVSYSGSFEIAGQDEDTRDAVWSSGDNEEQVTLPEYVNSMTIRHKDAAWEANFRHVMFNSRSKDMPSDDRTTDSYDFMAEKMTYSANRS